MENKDTEDTPGIGGTSFTVFMGKEWFANNNNIVTTAEYSGGLIKTTASVPNCLEYALLFWKEHPDYRIYYNSSHCINAYEAITGSGYLPAESFGYEYFKNSFKDLLSDYSKQLLKLYFNIK